MVARWVLVVLFVATTANGRVTVKSLKVEMICSGGGNYGLVSKWPVVILIQQHLNPKDIDFRSVSLYLI